MNAAQKAACVAVDKDAREKDDFYSTSPDAVERLLRVESFDGAVWEPACGDGAICRVLADRGYSVVATDLVDRGYGEPRVDFLMEYRPRAPNIITNPPFKLSTDFVRKALDLTTGKVAMLLRVTCLEGIERGEIYDNTPFARLWVFRQRVSFFRGGTEKWGDKSWNGMIAYGWFIWEHGYTGKPTLGWI